MRRIWLALLLAAGLFAAPLDGVAQRSGSAARVGLFHVGLDHDPPGLAPLRFVREQVNVVITFEDQAVRAAQAATSEIPVVFAHVSDPVAAGFVKSFARPGSNLTGVADYVGELQEKRVQISNEMVRPRRLLVLVDPTDPATARLMAELSRGASQLQIQLVERRATSEADLVKIFGSLKQGDVDGAITVSPKLVTNFPALILRLSQARTRSPWALTERKS
jgi:putative tryptophan/tyrosine transport system substrate-binding protein